MRRCRQWSLARVRQQCSDAPAVWVALSDMAAAKAGTVVTPTRMTLATATGIRRHKTISKALTTLESAGWITRCHVPIRTADGRATLLRIILCRRGRKTPHTEAHPVEGATRPKGRGRHAPHDFPKGKGAAESPPRPLDEGRAAAADGDGGSTLLNPAADLERQRMAAIRARREAKQEAST